MSTVSRLYPLSGLAALVLVGCSSQPTQPLKEGGKAVDVTSVVCQKMPASVKNRDAQTQDLVKTLKSQRLAPAIENTCLVLAVAQQELNSQADPAVPGLSRIAWKKIDRHAERMHIPLFVVHTALKINSPTGKSYSERLDTVKTEKQLSAIFDDLVNMVPVRQTLFGSLGLVYTDGSMQVGIMSTGQYTSRYPWKMARVVRQEAFSHRSGLWLGTHYLFDYPANCSAPISRFIDFNAGWYASRNATSQNAVSKASGVKLTMDGNPVPYGSSESGRTELTVRKLAGKLGMSESEIHQQSQRGDNLAFEKTVLYEKVHKLAGAKTGKILPHGMLPGIQPEGPKITRNLTTAWFAKRVDDRRAKCMSQPSL